MFTVRGKRTRPSPDGLIGNQGKAQKRGRSLQRASALRPARQILLAQQKQYAQQCKSWSRPNDTDISALESLPNELIQQIFFLSLAVNLAKASRRLASALSTESTFRVLILFAYFDEDEDYPVDVNLFLPARYRTLTLEEKLGLQARILGCRWCTYDRIVSSLPALSRLAIVQEWFREHDEETRLQSKFGAEFSVTVDDPDLQSQAKLPALSDCLGLETHFCAQARQLVFNHATEPEATSRTYLPRILTWVYETEDVERSLVRKKLGPSRSILPARCMLGGLLRGSPTVPEKFHLVQLLRTGFEHIKQDPVMMISASALLEAINLAITHRNHSALIHLLELHATFTQTRQRNGSEYVLTSQPTGPLLPLHSFHLATKQDDQSASLMWLLMRHDSRAIPHNDSVLTAWAVRLKTAPNMVAKHLLNLMAGDNDPDSLREGLINAQNGDVIGGPASYWAQTISVREAEELGRGLLPNVHVRDVPSPG